MSRKSLRTPNQDCLFSRMLDYARRGVTVIAFHNRLVTGWHVQAGVKANVQLAGGEPFTSGAVLRARAFHRLGKLGIRLTNDLGLIAGSNDYDYLSGMQNLTTIEFSRTIDDTRIRAGYQLELNDRDDLTFTDEFFSYSPTRHRLFASAEHSLAEGLSAELRLGFRSSEYNDENIELEDDNSVTQAARDEDRVTATLRVAYQATPLWTVFGEYRHADTDANFDRYGYDSSVFMLGVERAP